MTKDELVNQIEWNMADALLVKYLTAYLKADMENPNAGRAPGPMRVYIDNFLGWYDSYHRHMPAGEFLIMIGPHISSYVGVLGKTKEICIMRDEYISKFIKSHDETLAVINKHFPDFSSELMVEYPFAYYGIDASWAVPAKLCM